MSDDNERVQWAHYVKVATEIAQQEQTLEARAERERDQIAKRLAGMRAIAEILASRN